MRSKINMALTGQERKWRPMYSPTSKNPLRQPSTRSDWMTKCNYVRSQIDIRKSICGGCGSGQIYDKNNVTYTFTRIHTMDEIKALIEKVRAINNE